MLEKLIYNCCRAYQFLKDFIFIKFTYAFLAFSVNFNVVASNVLVFVFVCLSCICIEFGYSLA